MVKESIFSLARTGFGVGLGFMLASIVYIFIGILLFIPGFILLNKEQKKKKEDQRGSIKVIAFILMGLGMIITGGLGFSTLLGEVGDEL